VNEGENDCGLFAISCGPVAQRLAELKKSGQATGRKTGEFNFLPLIPTLEGGKGEVVTIRIANSPEVQGVNTRAEAASLEHFLRTRQGGA
jgi:bifunctional N-acetylglucosamine-1-phosphate-uridyltransferase/glucosamine-1-phosphate-acetyltransferase GlmU-like protein